ncbi:hypothetical protein [Pollutibacter soli]|uniref:hypothetical protein n=1 Tax=Pollutibacter soli TaxID=3034157 RepID=UPI00301333F8
MHDMVPGDQKAFPVMKYATYAMISPWWLEENANISTVLLSCRRLFATRGDMNLNFLRMV